MRSLITACMAFAMVVASALVPPKSSQLASLKSSPVFGQVVKKAERTRRTHSVYFPDVRPPSDAGISQVRLVLTCARVTAITEIPEDWYVQTLRPNVQSGPEWSEFQFASNAVEFAAGHGVTRLPQLRLLDGAVKIEVQDDNCFDITADIRDEIGGQWQVRIPRARLQLRQ